MHELRDIQFLVNQITYGEILLPEFQRGYVWNRTQARELVQSLYSKHPTGHLLIWRTYKPSRVRGGQEAKDGFSLLLLDGQQRLTTLYALFTGKAPKFYEGEELYFDLYFNLQTQEFRYWLEARMQNNPAWISVHKVLKHRLGGLLEDLKETNPAQRQFITEYIEHFNQLDKIRDYSYTLDQISSDDFGLDEVVEIFNRINSKGTPLRKSDLALAHLCRIWPEARMELRNFQEKMKQQGYTLHFSVMLRCVVGVATGSIALDRRFTNLNAEDFMKAWQAVCPAVEYFLTILRHEAYIGNPDNDLPYSGAIIPVVVYLSKHQGLFPTVAIKKRFIRWLYLACLWGRYSTSSDTKLQQDVVTVLGSSNSDPTKQLEEVIVRERGRIKVDPADLNDKGVDSTVAKLSIIVARSKNATDIFSGKPIYCKNAGSPNVAEWGYIFSRNLLDVTGISKTLDSKVVNQLANRVLLTQKPAADIANSPPERYLLEIAKVRYQALREQSIPLDREVWLTERFMDFLEIRRELLCSAINDYIEHWLPLGRDGGIRQNEVRTLITQRESKTLEFKSSLRWDLRREELNKELQRSVLKTLAAFMNTSGGICLIGVDDSGHIIGIEHDYNTLKKRDRDGFELTLGNLIGSKLGESCLMFVSTTFHRMEERDICQVTVEQSDHPVYVSWGEDHSFYVRTLNHTRSLNVKEAMNYAKAHFQKR